MTLNEQTQDISQDWWKLNLKIYHVLHFQILAD